MITELRKRDLSDAIRARARELLKLLEAQSPLSVPQYVLAQALTRFKDDTADGK